MRYGNASTDCVHWSSQNSFLDGIYSDLTDISLTPVEDPIIKSQLEEGRDRVNTLVKDTMLLKRYAQFDRGFFQYIRSFKFEEESVTDQYRGIVNDLLKDSLPVIHKLKLHYQRPRPFQLAYLHNVNLHPIQSLCNYPSFPSLHSSIALLIQYVCGNIFPEYYSYFKTFSEDVYNSRISMGVCLPGDVDAGRLVADRLFAVKEFKVKYRI
jgi:hypothetical protein